MTTILNSNGINDNYEKKVSTISQNLIFTSSQNLGKNRMIIGVNARMLLPHRMEGIARYSWETTKRMILNHPEDTFILFFDRQFDKEYIIADNVIGVILSPQARHPILWKIWFDWSLKRALKKHKVDVLYSPDGFCSLTTNVPTVLVSHDLAYLHYPKSMRQEQLAFYTKKVPLFHKKAEQIIAVSEATKSDIVSSFDVSRSKIKVAHNALQEIIREGNNKKVSKPYILYVGSIHPRKNIARLLSAYDMYRQHEDSKNAPKLIIAGRRAFQNDDVDKALNEMEFKQDVEFLGMVSEEEKWQLMEHASLFAYISLFEGFGIPILEAMSVKTPVLTSSGGALEEVAGGSALLVDPLNVEEVSKGIRKLLKQAELRESQIEKGIQRVSDFSWDKSAETIYKALQEVLNK